MIRRSFCLLLTLVVAACATPTIPIRRGVTTPHAIGIVCLDGAGKPIALDDVNCIDDNIRALVSGNDSVAAAIPAARTWLDVDESTPGFTPLRMPGLPGAIAIDAVHGVGYIAIPIIGWIVRVDLAGLGAYQFRVKDWQDVGVSAQDLILVQTPEPRLYMADPAGGKVWSLAIANFARKVGGGPIPPRAIPIGGQPSSLAWSPRSERLYIGHVATGYISVLEPELGTVEHIGLVAQCRNGLDDDGDGRTDRADSGCDGSDDAVEDAPEADGSTCFNGRDDDGDGLTDKADGGCNWNPPSTVIDACRNGRDDDGDGRTDFALGGGDPGCSGWGDTSEWSENAACTPGSSGCLEVAPGVHVAPMVHQCSDQVDNDRDGKTDAADADCAKGSGGSESARTCDNGADDDGDGGTDLADADCYNRAATGEVSQATALHTLVAATFAGRFVVIADRTRRALLVVDADKNVLLRPVPGQTAPFARAGYLDARDGIPGISLQDMPLSLAPAQVTDVVTRNGVAQFVRVPVMAVGLTQIGVQFLHFSPWGQEGAIGVDLLQAPLDVTPTLSAGRPLLLIPGVSLDLPTTVPTRFAAFGSGVTQDATGRVVYYGLLPGTNVAEQRTETWRFTREGLLPGAQGDHARLPSAGLLHDPAQNFCATGVLKGDMLQLKLPATPACQGGGTFDFPLTAVHAEKVEFDALNGVRDADAIVTYANQLTFDAAARHVFTGVLTDCVAAADIAYTVRAQGWLARGGRSGLLSTRAARDGECLAIPDEWLAGSRVQEPTLQPGRTAADVTICPGAAEPLDPKVWQVRPYVHPMFSGSLSPGCDSSTFDANGDRIAKLIPSIRDAEWVYGVGAGTAPRTTRAGSSPVAMASGPGLDTLFVVDEGAGLLQFVRVSDGVLLDTPLD